MKREQASMACWVGQRPELSEVTVRGLDHLEPHKDRKQGNDLTDVHFQRRT